MAGLPGSLWSGEHSGDFPSRAISIDMKGDRLLILVVDAMSNGFVNLHQGNQTNDMSTPKIVETTLLGVL